MIPSGMVEGAAQAHGARSSGRSLYDNNVTGRFRPGVGYGDYGYCNSNGWCSVSIPIADFVARNPKLDLRFVNFRFIVADRFSFTGKPLNQTGLPLLRIDNLHWSR